MIPGYLVPQDEIMLVDLLQGVPLPRLPVLHQVHRAVRPVGDQLDHLHHHHYHHRHHHHHQLDHLEVLLGRRLGLELLPGLEARPRAVAGGQRVAVEVAGPDIVLSV